MRMMLMMKVYVITTINATFRTRICEGRGMRISRAAIAAATGISG
jgi:hypothetical protein